MAAAGGTSRSSINTHVIPVLGVSVSYTNVNHLHWRTIQAPVFSNPPCCTRELPTQRQLPLVGYTAQCNSCPLGRPPTTRSRNSPLIGIGTSDHIGGTDARVRE